MNLSLELTDESSDIQRLRSHGPAELAQQFSDASERLKRMVGMRLHPKIARRVDASDVVQDAFIEASRRLPEYLAAPRVSPFLWLRGITRQMIAHYHRSHLDTAKRSVDRETSGVYFSINSNSIALEFEASMVSPHSEVAKQELTTNLLKIIESMDPADREVLVLKQLEELSFAEVADELEISLAAAMKRFQRAILRLGQLAAHLNQN